uniref:Phospholipase/carboxylesterase/thioesterase domain-containing protein n=1 Tax=Pyramimonas obovata TaxID=1411642 RepID=A0A7S0RX35_9CHLO|mmetsp:Transcript_8292/g.17100  ORF Transcript_8292/g.17100 Transcript_8292/m.17100 type:complete len:276 (+) Transcript_8292:304-1131(+)
MKLAIAILLAFVLATPVQGYSTHVSRGHGEREVLIGVPESSPTSLLVMLHGFLSNGQAIFNKMTRVSSVEALEYLDEKRMLTAAPTGNLDQKGFTHWKATKGCCGTLLASEQNYTEDPQYVRDLATSLLSEYPSISRESVFVLGFSNGGFLAQRVACLHSDLFSAIVSMAGMQVHATADAPNVCAPTHPASALLIHGVEDKVIPYGGGSTVWAPFPSSEASVEQWAEAKGCPVPVPDAPYARINLLTKDEDLETEKLMLTECGSGDGSLRPLVCS